MSDLRWRQAGSDDLDAMLAIQAEVHTLEPESRDVFASKLDVFPRGCMVLGDGAATEGYGIFHPWRLDDAPSLHAMPFRMPDQADCLFVHDVALRPAARGRGAARTLLGEVRAVARDLGLASLALVSVYGTAPTWQRLGFVRRPLAFSPAKRAQYGDTACYMACHVAA